MSPECSKHQVLSFAKILVMWWTDKKYSVLISVLRSAQWINSERIYPQTRVSPFPRLISVACVNEQRATDVTRVLKAPGAELYQNACGVVNEQKINCSYQCYPKSSMNKFSVYVYSQTHVSYTIHPWLRN